MRTFDPLDLSHEHYLPRAEGSAEQPAGQHRHLRFWILRRQRDGHGLFEVLADLHDAFRHQDP